MHRINTLGDGMAVTPTVNESQPAKLWRQWKAGSQDLLKFMSSREEGAIEPEAEWSQCRQMVSSVILSHGFVTFMACVLIINIVLVMIETDRRISCDNASSSLECSTKYPDIRILDRICCAIYVVELMCRGYVYQSKFCWSLWNLADAVLVTIGMLGQLFEGETQNFVLLRLVRVVRVVRILKVVTMFHELYLMLASLASTIRTIFWACIMLLLVLTVLALISVELLNPLQNQIIEEKAGDVCDRCLVAFSSVPRSMVTLFSTIIMGDGITDIFVPLIEKDVVAALFILLSVALVYLGFSNLVLSVIVDKANESREQDIHYQAAMTRQMKKRTKLELLALWQEIDIDGDDSLTWPELVSAYESSKAFQEYCRGMNVDLTWLQYAFTVMDPNGDGTRSFRDFAGTLVRLKNTDPGPAISLLTFQMEKVLAQLTEVRAQVDQSHPSGVTRDQPATSAVREEEASSNVASASCGQQPGEPALRASPSESYSNMASPARRWQKPGQPALQASPSLQPALRAEARAEASGLNVFDVDEIIDNMCTRCVEAPAIMSPHEDTPSEVEAIVDVEKEVASQLQATEDLVELLREVHEGPQALNKQYMHLGTSADLCKRVKGQLGRLMALLPNAKDDARLELFACSARLLGSFGAAMPRMFPGYAASSTAQTLADPVMVMALQALPSRDVTSVSDDALQSPRLPAALKL